VKVIVVDVFIKFLVFYGTRNLSCLLLLYLVLNQCNSFPTSKSSLTLISAFHLSLFSLSSQTYFMLHFFSLNFMHILVFTMYVCNNCNTSSDEYRLCCVHLLLISMSLHAYILQKTLFLSALRNRTFCTIIINIFSLHSSLRVSLQRYFRLHISLCV
jgi:hypothetical protein